MTTTPCSPVSAIGHVTHLEFVSAPLAAAAGMKVEDTSPSKPVPQLKLYLIANILNLGDCRYIRGQYHELGVILTRLS
jgi:hypothetical protein